MLADENVRYSNIHCCNICSLMFCNSFQEYEIGFTEGN